MPSCAGVAAHLPLVQVAHLLACPSLGHANPAAAHLPVCSCIARCRKHSCIGLFASEGRCQECGADCRECDAKGACLECNSYYALVNGACQPCPDFCKSW